jgi:hypothetical protein
MTTAAVEVLVTASFKRGIFITILTIRDFHRDVHYFSANASVRNYDKTANVSVRFVCVLPMFSWQRIASRRIAYPHSSYKAGYMPYSTNPVSSISFINNFS